MSLFSTALIKALSTVKWTQKRLANKTGFNPIRVSRYKRGDPIGIKQVTEILNALPDECSAALLVAFLQDHIPPGMEYLVSVTACDTPFVAETSSTLPEGIDDDLRDNIVFIASICMRHTEARDMVRNFARLMRKK